MKIVIITVLYLLGLSLAHAQESDSTDSFDTYEYSEEENAGIVDVLPHTEIPPDELRSTQEYTRDRIFNKHFDENKWREIIGDNDFQEKPPERSNDFKLPKSAWGGLLLQVIMYAAIIGLVGFLVYYVVKNTSFRKKAKKPAIVGQYLTDSQEDIHELDIPSLLKQALAEGNFKMAIRLYYLSLLKNLHDAGLIKWEKDKTNREYVSELFGRENYYDDVRKLTRVYEEVWYGDHSFSDESLQSMIARFESVVAKLNPGKNP